MSLTKFLALLTCVFLVFGLPGFTCADSPAGPSVTSTCNSAGFCDASIQSGGRTRTFHYYVHTSPYLDSQHLYHIIFVFHDNMATGANFDKDIAGGSMADYAAKYHFVMVFPDAIDGHWNFGADSHNTGVDDVGFIKELRAYFNSSHSNYHLYLMGMGNGGMMVYRLMCDMSQTLMAAAVVDANMPTSIVNNCKPTRAIPLLMFEGRNDMFVPWDKNYVFDTPGQPVIPTLNSEQTFTFWKTKNHILIVPTYYTIPVPKYDGTHIFTELVRNRLIAMRFYTIYGAGHTWPGGTQYQPENVVGKVTRNLEATPVIMNFFYDFQ
jgi:polyhydroxybutyrate depolymerase